MEAEPELFAAQARAEQLINRDHGHRASSLRLFDIKSVVKEGFKAIEYAIAQPLLGWDIPELIAGPRVQNVAGKLFRYQSKNDLDLTPLVHCNVAAMVKQVAVAVFKGDRFVSHWANGVLDAHELQEHILQFRSRFEQSPWPDCDYADLVQEKLIKRLQLLIVG